VDGRDSGRDPARVTDASPSFPKLPPRPPRSFVIHWLVDAAIVFVAVLFLALITGIPLIPLAIVALVAGAIAAPFTRRAEIRALAARDIQE
jgi:hypothetical protein